MHSIRTWQAQRLKISGAFNSKELKHLKNPAIYTHLAGFEPATNRLGTCYSIQAELQVHMQGIGIEPM